MKRVVATVVLAVALIMSLALSAAASGGNVVVSFKSDVSTLDPAIGYDWQNWSIIKSIFNGLMDYVPGTTKLRTKLAKSYEISPDGLTYTFHLRDDVVFHNGRKVVASDVKYSLERVLNPETQSPGLGFYLGIKGAKAFSEGEAEEVSGIKVIDDHTIQFVLNEPNAAFLHILALNFSFVVPKEEVEKYGKDFGHHPVGTGAFRLKEWVLGQRLVLERNPDYFIPNRPQVDQITFLIGIEPTVALLKLQRGEVDILGDGIPPARFVQVMKDPKLSKLVEQGEQIQTGYVTLNTRVKPLDNKKVRQALNMAINKERICLMINNRAVPANQVLPPLMPGYDTEFSGYPYDPEKAKALLAEAGYSNGFSTVLYCSNVDPNPRIAQAIQQDLAAIGVNVEIKALAPSTVIQAGGTEGGAPMLWSGGMAWIADYPDPNNFYWPILASASATSGGWNWAWYSNPELDALAAKADTMVAPEEQEERLELWKKIYRQVMEDAPWIPIFHEKRFTMHSERLTGPEGIFVDPIHIPVNYEEVQIR
ncbi:MAG: ABC transporter substrate-binding protein [Firmicutes bacterium]|nr:ABC transporter substrate-binding protein [Bacillota bacterium]